MVDVGARWGISKTKPKTSATPKSKVRKTSSKPKAKSRPAAQLADRWGLRPSRLKPKTLARASSAASSSASVPKRPVDEDAEAECLGPADETDLQHTARHSANSDQCSRCRQISSLQFMVVVTCFFFNLAINCVLSSFGVVTDSCGSKIDGNRSEVFGIPLGANLNEPPG